MKTKITKESLLKFGMVETNDPAIKLSKVLVNDGEVEMRLQLTWHRNSDEFTLYIDDYGLLYINATCIEDLEAIERLVSSFESFY